jgi:hypothetical protein
MPVLRPGNSDDLAEATDQGIGMEFANNAVRWGGVRRRMLGWGSKNKELSLKVSRRFGMLLFPLLIDDSSILVDFGRIRDWFRFSFLLTEAAK